MSKFIVTEMQNGIVGSNSWVYDTREDAEVKYYQVLAEVVKSPVEVHTVILMTDEGFMLYEPKCYKHVQPAPEPEPEPTPDSEPEEETIPEGEPEITEGA